MLTHTKKLLLRATFERHLMRNARNYTCRNSRARKPADLRAEEVIE